MAVLEKDRIEEFMRSDAPVQRRIVITPLLDRKQVQEASVDLRLGHEFIVFNHSTIGMIDPADHKKIKQRIHQYQHRERIRRRSQFVLHPQQFALGATLEYVVVPAGIEATVAGRSTWGRTGLVIATATKVAPGFKGCITLELANEGVVPIVLRPGNLVVQIVFQETTGARKYSGRYRYPTGPAFPDFNPPPDASFWADPSDD